MSVALSLVLGLVDKVIPDSTAKNKITAGLMQGWQEVEKEQLATARATLIAELSGESWLQRNWRPLVMLFLTGLVGAHWLGFTAPNINDAVVVELLSIVKVGIGGYVVGRSAEKVMKEYTKKG